VSVKIRFVVITYYKPGLEFYNNRLVLEKNHLYNIHKSQSKPINAVPCQVNDESFEQLENKPWGI
jgi:hypothetical protein